MIRAACRGRAVDGSACGPPLRFRRQRDQVGLWGAVGVVEGHDQPAECAVGLRRRRRRQRERGRRAGTERDEVALRNRILELSQIRIGPSIPSALSRARSRSPSAGPYSRLPPLETRVNTRSSAAWRCHCRKANACCGLARRGVSHLPGPPFLACRYALYRSYVLLAQPSTEPISHPIRGRVPLGKAQRIEELTYESPALPLSYSAKAADSLPIPASPPMRALIA